MTADEASPGQRGWMRDLVAVNGCFIGLSLAFMFTRERLLFKSMASVGFHFTSKMQISLHTVIPVVWNSWLKALSGLNVAALNICETHLRNQYVTTSHGQCEFEFLCANFITGKVCALFSHRLKVDFFEPTTTEFFQMLDPIMPLEFD